MKGVFDGSFATLTAWLETEFKPRSQSVHLDNKTSIDNLDDS